MEAVPTQYDRYSWLRADGRRVAIRSGAMHYFRLPSPDTWRDRLNKLKALGYNTVDLYFNWEFHQPTPEPRFDFEGNRDIALLLQLVREAGLWLIARPGPYINAETSTGGLPPWLIGEAQRGKLLPRHRHADGRFEWSQPYFDAVKTWWDVLLPKIAAVQDNLLAIQVENEFVTLDLEPEPLTTLIEVVRAHGITRPVFHNDLYAQGLYADVVDMYAFDHYSLINYEHFDNPKFWHAHPEIFSVIDRLEDTLRPVCENAPLFAAEFQSGWFSTWRGASHAHIREALGTEHITIATKSLLGQGASMVNHYLAVGGTNWGRIGSAETVTSYDFTAPISEAGRLMPNGKAARQINMLLESFPDVAATDPGEGCINPETQNVCYAVRSSVVNPQTRWGFWRNLDLKPVTYHHPELPSATVTLKSFNMAILPENLPLATPGLTLAATTAEPLWQAPGLLVARVLGDRATLAINGLADAAPQPFEKPQGWAAHPLQTAEGATFWLYLVDDATAQLLCPLGWLNLDARSAIKHLGLAGHDVIVGDFQPEADGMALAQDAALHVFTAHGPRHDIIQAEPVAPVALPTLDVGAPAAVDWSLVAERGLCQPVGPGADALNFERLGFGNPEAWHASWATYAIRFEDRLPPKLRLEARHMWAVLLDGQVLASGEMHAPLGHETKPVPKEIDLEPWREQAGPHTVLVFVDSLGRPKGFHEDIDEPQGLWGLDALTNEGWQPLENIQVLLGRDGYPLVPVESNAYMLRYEASFNWQFPQNVTAPLYFVVEDTTCERADVFLNGVQVGRYWPETAPQENKFYLLPGILRSGHNALTLWRYNFEAPLSPDRLEDFSHLHSPSPLSLRSGGVTVAV